MKTAFLLAIALPLSVIAQDKPNEPASEPVGQAGSHAAAEPKKESAPKPAAAIVDSQPNELTISGGDLVKGGLVAGTVGGIVAAIINAFVAYWNRAHEDRKQIRELAMQLAVEKWKATDAGRQRRHEFLTERNREAGRLGAPPPQPPVLGDVVETMYAFISELESKRNPGLWARINARFKPKKK